jgi:hypothetical protein
MSKTWRIIVAVLVIVVLAAVTIPNFVRPRIDSAQNACVNSLRVIQVAKSRWAEIYHKGPADTPTESDLFCESNSIAFSKGTVYTPGAFTRMPYCPAGGTLIIGAINEEPRCSTGWASHSLHPQH